VAVERFHRGCQLFAKRFCGHECNLTCHREK
jgi:hypothetical protein